MSALSLSSRHGATLAGLVALALVLAARPSLAAASVPADLQVEIITRVLEYDRALGSRLGGDLTIGLLFQEGRPSSQNLEILEAFLALQGRSIQGLSVAVVQRSYRGADDLGLWLENERVDLLYVDPGLASRGAEIRTRCQEQSVIGVTGERKLVEEGFALGIVSRRNRPHVVVNLSIAEAAGMDLEGAALERFELLR